MKPGDLVLIGSVWLAQKSPNDLLTGMIVSLAFERPSDTYYNVLINGTIDIIPLSSMRRISETR
jgi:hypothetical protein